MSATILRANGPHHAVSVDLGDLAVIVAQVLWHSSRKVYKCHFKSGTIQFPADQLAALVRMGQEALGSNVPPLEVNCSGATANIDEDTP
jgi:hypothetical protein